MLKDADGYKDLAFYKRALELYFEVLDICKITDKTGRHVDVIIKTADIYGMIGFCYREQGEYDMAFEWYYKALDHYNEVISKWHPKMAAVYAEIGTVYNRIGDYEIADQWCQKAIDILEEYQQGFGYELASAYNAKAEVCFNYKDYEKVIELSGKVFGITSVRDSRDKDIATAYYNNGCAYRELKRYEEAVTCLRMAERGYSGSLGASNPLTKKATKTIEALVEYLIENDMCDTVVDKYYHRANKETPYNYIYRFTKTILSRKKFVTCCEIVLKTEVDKIRDR